jgi:DNA-binding GntR family transcriptional regulator
MMTTEMTTETNKLTAITTPAASTKGSPPGVGMDTRTAQGKTRGNTAKQSRVQLVREHLEDDIVEGRLLPGAQLYVEDIARTFDMSRTPVREALQQLEASGLVEVFPKRGTYVAALGVNTMMEMFEVMAELEAMCASLAAKHATKAMHAELAQAVEMCELEASQGDANSYYRANELFHHLIYKASGNHYLLQQTLQLKNRLKPYRRMQLQISNRIAQSLAEHRSLFNAICAGDWQQASAAARGHVVVQGQRFTDLIALIRKRTEDANALGSATTAGQRG